MPKSFIEPRVDVVDVKHTWLNCCWLGLVSVLTVEEVIFSVLFGAG